MTFSEHLSQEIAKTQSVRKLDTLNPFEITIGYGFYFMECLMYPIDNQLNESDGKWRRCIASFYVPCKQDSQNTPLKPILVGIDKHQSFQSKTKALLMTEMSADREIVGEEIIDLFDKEKSFNISNLKSIIFLWWIDDLSEVDQHGFVNF